MKNIVLCCAAGMSTSMLVQRMKDAAQKKGIEVAIKAVPVAEFKDNIASADIVLLGPQVKYEQANLQAQAEPLGKKVSVIDMMDYGMMKGEAVIMELLVNAGAARSEALTALRFARNGEFAQAEKAMAESQEYVKQAHRIQTQLIGMDEGSGKLPVNLITVHSQDHLMNAMVIQDLATDMIELYRRLPVVK